MTGPSVLWPVSEYERAPAADPLFFRDLNLDQIFSAIVGAKSEYNLGPFFRQPLRSVVAIEYRQAAMRDVQREPVLAVLRPFADAMRTIRANLAQAAKLYYKYQKEAGLLDAAGAYCDAVRTLDAELASADTQSDAFAALKRFLSEYVAAQPFQTLLADIAAVTAKLDEIRYTLLIRGGSVTVARYLGQTDYEGEIEEDFSRFKQGEVARHAFKFANFAQMNHIEAGILDRIAKLFPEAFDALDDFGARHDGFVDSTIAQFDREAQFYIAYHEHITRLTVGGVSFCFPEVTTKKGDLHASGAFDLALAHSIASKGAPIVTNDFRLEHQERIIIVSGPNQGGKTTFARTFGQLHYLSSLGLPIPGESARLFAFDQIYTHFETSENLHNLRGKLYDDLHRLRSTITEATPDSIVILNEVFNSTSLKDAIFLSGEILKAILRLDAICVCVTFIDELAALSEKMVSMASTVNPQNVAERTFKIIRKPPDGLAYAISIAEKYKLTYRQLQERLAS
jgi:DNA mismatch repair protein MutS